jgi:AbiV family abortive infection protein
MSNSKYNSVLTLAQLQRGYELSIDNALRLLDAASKLAEDFPDKALGLAQIGQEEVGKSLSLLAAGALPPDPGAWDWLWSGWRDHELKAHRAYLYEIICPLRIEAAHPEQGEYYAGGPLLDRLPAEKEVSFYVDFDKALGSFVSPEELVDRFAAFARTSTATYLIGTADAVRRALIYDDADYRFREFSQVAFMICSQEVYQQDWPGIRDRFSTQSPWHKAIIDDINVALEGTASVFRNAVKDKRSEPTSDVTQDRWPVP